MHFGIKGMRWGVRRWQNPDGTLTEAGKKHYLKKGRLDKLSDSDIQSAIERMNLEKKYKDIENQLRPKKEGKREAREFVVDCLKTSGKKLFIGAVDRHVDKLSSKAQQKREFKKDEKRYERDWERNQNEYKRDWDREQERYKRDYDREKSKYDSEHLMSEKLKRQAFKDNAVNRLSNDELKSRAEQIEYWRKIEDREKSKKKGG